MSFLSHSFCFPRLWTQHQEVMPNSCLLGFPHCERKCQNHPFQIGTFHFCFSFPPCPCDSIFFLCPLSSTNKFTCMGFLLLWKGCIPGPQDFDSVSRFPLLVCSPTTVWLLWAAWLFTCLPLVSRLSPTSLLLTCMSHDVPDVSDGGVGTGVARESKPGKNEIKNEIKTKCKRDPSSGRSKLPDSKIGRLNHMKETATVAVQQRASRRAATVPQEPIGLSYTVAGKYGTTKVIISLPVNHWQSHMQSHNWHSCTSTHCLTISCLLP